MAYQLVSWKGKYYFVDKDTFEIKEVHLDKAVINQTEIQEVLKVFVEANYIEKK